MSPTTHPQPPYPLHESVRDKLDPAYVEFYNKYIIDAQQVHYQPLSVSRSNTGNLIPGSGPKLPVGKTEDVTVTRCESEGPDLTLRCFTPEGDIPVNGWPVFIYFHGGGWVFGNLDSENTLCTHICARSKVVVVSVDYRLAPEFPWPAAVNDCWETLLWIQDAGARHLSLNLDKQSLGGTSAGGNLAAIMLQKALSRGLPPFLAQILLVPVTDNTATVETNWAWRDFRYTPALPAEKMLWYRRQYLPESVTWTHPEASPLLWDSELWVKIPRTLIVVGELDILRAEGELFAGKLERAGVGVDLVVMRGMPHPFVVMDGVLEAGREAITLIVEMLNDVLLG